MRRLARIFDWVASPREPVSSLSHLFGAALAAYGTVALLTRAGDRDVHLAISLIYGCSVIFLFLASSMLHGMRCSERSVLLLEKLDHIGIYLVIAATYTPVCMLLIKGTTGLVLLTAQWTLAAIGIAFTLCKPVGTRRVSFTVYMLMGWVAVLVSPTLLRLLSPEDTLWFLFGAALYTIGAVVFVLDRPHLRPGLVNAHDLWHIMVVLATFCHYMMVRGVMA